MKHEAERLRQEDAERAERAERAEHDRMRRELEEAGITITEILPASAQLLTSLCQDEEVLTPESHPGRNQITGRNDRDWLDTCGTAPAAPLPLAMLAPIVTAYEHAMTEGEGKNTWRSDRYSPCPRQEAASYLAFLTNLGYQLAAIEQAVADQTPYTGETPTGQSFIGETDSAEEPEAPDASPGDTANGAKAGSGDEAEAGGTDAGGPPTDDGALEPDADQDQIAA